MENFKKTLEENNLVIHKDGQTIPINTTIAPTHFPYQQYKAVEEKQHIMNKLIYNIMKHDKDKIDDTFWDMLNKIKRCKPKKDIDGLFIRTDYLLDEDNVMKQVEINTISLAFKFFGPMLNRIHKLKCDETIVSDSDKEFINFVKEIKQDYEDDAVAIMVDNDTSMASSNYFEKSEIIRLLKVHGIGMYHLTFQDMIKTCQFRTRDGNEVEDSDVVKILKEGKMINSEYEMYYYDRKVFFIYYRWYYNESHYTPEDITMRSKLEFSSAFSLQSVELQMAGHKAYQIKYLHRSYLRKFLTDEEVESIFPHFGKFKNYEDLKNEDEENYILKSYKEGGGNNLFGEEIYKYKGNKKNVFLMKKICSKHSRNTFVNSDEEIEVIPEIGIMGWVIGRNGKIHHNKNAGYICRTKNIKSNECGVSCGFGALDSLTKNIE